MPRKKIEKESEKTDLTQKAYMAIRQMLFYNEIQAGQKIKYKDLSSRIGVSMTPVFLQAYHDGHEISHDVGGSFRVYHPGENAPGTHGCVVASVQPEPCVFKCYRHLFTGTC